MVRIKCTPRRLKLVTKLPMHRDSRPTFVRSRVELVSQPGCYSGLEVKDFPVEYSLYQVLESDKWRHAQLLQPPPNV